MTASARRGPAGPPGPPGSGDKTYRHQQLSGTAVWTITHNLGKRPSVEVIDSTGANWDADVDYVDDDTLTITFPAAVGGEAYLN